MSYHLPRRPSLLRSRVCGRRLNPSQVPIRLSELSARTLATQLSHNPTPTPSPGQKAKKEGDISSVFASLSNESSQPLPERFITLKRSIVGAEGSESLDRVYESWKDLLSVLKREVEEIGERGNEVRFVSLFRHLFAFAFNMLRSSFPLLIHIPLVI
jgi:hypothetical protein